MSDPTLPEPLKWALGVVPALGALGQFIWRQIEKSHERIRAEHREQIAEINAQHARETATLAADLKREREAKELVSKKLEVEREGRYQDAIKIAKAALAHRVAYDQPSAFEEELPTIARRVLDVAPRSDTPPRVKGPGVYREKT